MSDTTLLRCWVTVAAESDELFSINMRSPLTKMPRRISRYEFPGRGEPRTMEQHETLQYFEHQDLVMIRDAIDKFLATNPMDHDLGY